MGWRPIAMAMGWSTCTGQFGSVYQGWYVNEQPLPGDCALLEPYNAWPDAVGGRLRWKSCYPYGLTGLRLSCPPYHLCYGLPTVCRSATSFPPPQKKRGERRDGIFSQVQSWVANGKLPPSLKSITPPPGRETKKTNPSDAGGVLLECSVAVFCFVLFVLFLCFRMFLPKVASHGVDVSVNPGSSAPAFRYSSLC